MRQFAHKRETHLGRRRACVRAMPAAIRWFVDAASIPSRRVALRHRRKRLEIARLNTSSISSCQNQLPTGVDCAQFRRTAADY